MSDYTPPPILGFHEMLDAMRREANGDSSKMDELKKIHPFLGDEEDYEEDDRMTEPTKIFCVVTEDDEDTVIDMNTKADAEKVLTAAQKYSSYGKWSIQEKEVPYNESLWAYGSAREAIDDFDLREEVEEETDCPTVWVVRGDYGGDWEMAQIFTFSDEAEADKVMAHVQAPGNPYEGGWFWQKYEDTIHYSAAAVIRKWDL